MNEQPAAPTQNAHPLNSVVDELFKDSKSLSAHPRSFAVEMPKDMVAFAETMERTAKLSIEYILSYDVARKHLVLTTGDEVSAIHQDVEEDFKLTERIMGGSNFLHNHPTKSGLTFTMPSPGDLIALSLLHHDYVAPRYSYIVTEKGLVRFGYPRHVPTPEQHEKKIKMWVPEIKEKLNISTTNPRMSELTPETLDKFDRLSQLYMAEWDVENELIPWSDKKKVGSALMEFIRSSTFEALLRRLTDRE